MNARSRVAKRARVYAHACRYKHYIPSPPSRTANGLPIIIIMFKCDVGGTSNVASLFRYVGCALHFVYSRREIRIPGREITASTGTILVTGLREINVPAYAPCPTYVRLARDVLSRLYNSAAPVKPKARACELFKRRAIALTFNV